MKPYTAWMRSPSRTTTSNPTTAGSDAPFGAACQVNRACPWWASTGKSHEPWMNSRTSRCMRAVCVRKRPCAAPS
jgi:hypothetical protein